MEELVTKQGCFTQGKQKFSCVEQRNLVSRRQLMINLCNNRCGAKRETIQVNGLSETVFRFGVSLTDFVTFSQLIPGFCKFRSQFTGLVEKF